MTPLARSCSRQALAPSLRRRWLRSSSSSSAHASSINLTPYASPLLLRLHPDRMQRHALRNPTAARDNEDALKQLNQFLEIASAGCNSDSYKARRQILTLAAEHHDEPDAPIRWEMRFHVETADSSDETLTPVSHIVDVPAALVRRTLAHGTRAAAANQIMTGSPFAREWQRTTKLVLHRLFDAAHIPLYNPPAELDADTSQSTEAERGTPTQLALWLEQEESEELQYERGVADHNAATHCMHRDFDKLFTRMLATEKNVVHTTTTGLEDGPTTQHVILTRLIAQRLFLEKIPDHDEKKRVFFWLANVLLVHFMELRLHSLVWNKVMLMVTKDASLQSPEVLWNRDRPDEGMAILIPAGMDAPTLVDVLYEHTEELELALNARATRHMKQTQRSQPPKRKQKKRHFYSDEVDALFRRR